MVQHVLCSCQNHCLPHLCSGFWSKIPVCHTCASDWGPLAPQGGGGSVQAQQAQRPGTTGTTGTTIKTGETSRRKRHDTRSRSRGNVQAQEAQQAQQTRQAQQAQQTQQARQAQRAQATTGATGVTGTPTGTTGTAEICAALFSNTTPQNPWARRRGQSSKSWTGQVRLSVRAMQRTGTQARLRSSRRSKSI